MNKNWGPYCHIIICSMNFDVVSKYLGHILSGVLIFSWNSRVLGKFWIMVFYQMWLSSLFIYYSPVYVHELWKGGTYTIVNMWRSEDNFLQLVFYFHLCVDSSNGSQMLGLLLQALLPSGPSQRLQICLLQIASLRLWLLFSFSWHNLSMLTNLFI